MNNWKINEGMTVRSSDGEKVGKVAECGTSTFVVESGFIFTTDRTLRYEDISSVAGDDIYLAYTKDQVKNEDFFLRRSGAEAGIVTGTRADDLTRPAGTRAADDLSRTGDYPEAYSETARTADRDLYADTTRSGTTSSVDADLEQRQRTSTTRTARTGEEVSVPLTEEEVTVEKTAREAGEVRVRKNVVTETRHIEVPVTREEVHIERVPVEERSAGARAFEEETVSVPVMEEEVEVRKRPVVKEEVRIRKSAETEMQAADTTVRREEIDVEEEGDVAHKEGDKLMPPPKRPHGKGHHPRP